MLIRLLYFAIFKHPYGFSRLTFVEELDIVAFFLLYASRQRILKVFCPYPFPVIKRAAIPADGDPHVFRREELLAFQVVLLAQILLEGGFSASYANRIFHARDVTLSAVSAVIPLIARYHNHRSIIFHNYRLKRWLLISDTRR